MTIELCRVVLAGAGQTRVDHVAPDKLEAHLVQALERGWRLEMVAVVDRQGDVLPYHARGVHLGRSAR